MKVLVADDSAPSRAMLRSTLSRWGYEVILAEDGAEAWGILAQPNPPPMAILDWVMPGLTGPEVIRHVRETHREPYTYMLLLTSKNSRAETVEGLEAGADDYLIKPFDQQELHVRLRAGKRIVELQADLMRATEEVRVMLNNLEEGLVTVNLDGQVSSETSRAVKGWFGTPLAGENFGDWIGRKNAMFGDWFNLALESLKEGILPPQVALSQLPSSLKDRTRTYSFRYQMITNAGEPPDQLSAPDKNQLAAAKILVIITDITEILSKNAAESHQRELLQLFQHMMHDKSGFLEFLTEADDIVRSLKHGNNGQPDYLKRLLHTLKGNSAIFGMRRISELCHDMENKIAEEGEAPTALAALIQAWEQIRADIDKLIGEARQSSIEIDEGDYQTIIKALREGVEASEVACMMESCRLERASRRLMRIEDQIKGMAERMGRSNLSVSVEANDLRFDNEYFAPFWSAFVHVLRNAVDHGVEDRQQRQKAGKGAQSLIKVTTSIVADRFVVAVEDDGPGINWELLRRKAAALGVPDSAIDEPVTLLCMPGLSSKDEATELSGRGVGLSAVVAACEALGGRVAVKSQPGMGTRFEFAFPKDQHVYQGHAAILDASSLLLAN